MNKHDRYTFREMAIVYYAQLVEALQQCAEALGCDHAPEELSSCLECRALFAAEQLLAEIARQSAEKP